MRVGEEDHHILPLLAQAVLGVVVLVLLVVLQQHLEQPILVAVVEAHKAAVIAAQAAAE